MQNVTFILHKIHTECLMIKISVMISLIEKEWINVSKEHQKCTFCTPYQPSNQPEYITFCLEIDHNWANVDLKIFQKIIN